MERGALWGLTFVLVLVLGPTDAHAQMPAQPLTRQGAADASRPMKDATASSVIHLPDVALSLTGGRGEKKAEARAGIAVGDWTVDAKLSGPLGEGAPEANFATLGGLSNAAALHIGTSYLWWKPQAEATAQRPVCERYQRSLAKTLDEAKKVATPGAVVVCNLVGLPRESFRQQFLAAATDVRRREVCTAYALSMLLAPETFVCDAASLPTVPLAEEWDSAVDWSLPVAVGARWGVGRNRLRWADQTSGDLMAETGTPWEVGVGVNLLLPNLFVMSIEYRHVTDFDQRSKREICQPLGEGPVLTCQELPFGKFTQTQRELATLTLRRWVGLMAIDVRYTFDFDDSTHNVEIPFHFLMREGEGLTGGVAAGWTSKDDAERGGWTVRAFVGDVLTVWPRR